MERSKSEALGSGSAATSDKWTADCGLPRRLADMGMDAVERLQYYVVRILHGG